MSDLSFANRDITKFREKLNAGGVRSNLFEVEIPDIPGGGADVSDQIRFLVKAAEIPASNIGNIPVPFRGRILPVAGDRRFDPWTVTIINDDFRIRDTMEKWSDFINNVVNASGSTDPASYQRNGIVKQLSRSKEKDGKGMVLRQYNFIGIYPNAISSLKFTLQPYPNSPSFISLLPVCMAAPKASSPENLFLLNRLLIRC